MNKDKIIDILYQFKKSNGEKYNISKIGLFGSVARGEMHERSDVDIVVEITEPDMFSLIGIKQDLEEKLNMPVDVVRYRDKMNKFLKGKIEKEAVYV